MKNLLAIAVLAVAAIAVQAEQVNPLAKVFQLINDLKQRIVDDGEREQKAFEKFADYCGLTAKDVQYEIDTASSLQDKLTSKVAKLTSDIEIGDTKVTDYTGAISKAEAELKGATDIRKKEAEDFAEGEKALMATVDTLERALSVLEKQAAAGQSFAQLDTSMLANIVQTLGVVDDAAAMDGSGMDALTALVQEHDEDGDLEAGAPAAAAYTKQSGGIMDALEEMKDKAENQLADLRRNEAKAKRSYQLLRQGLQDEIKASQKELQEEQAAKAEAGEEKASSQGNLEVTKKEKETASQKSEETKSDCQTVASDHEANVAARKEELKVITDAEKILEESTGGAQKQTYSFLQVRASTSSKAAAKARELASSRVISMVQQLAKFHHSASLSQLASQISAELRYSTVRHGADPFKKVKDMVTSMINKLEKQAAEEATEKAYCDEELSKTDKKTERA